MGLWTTYLIKKKKKTAVKGCKDGYGQVTSSFQKVISELYCFYQQMTEDIFLENKFRPIKETPI